MILKAVGYCLCIFLFWENIQGMPLPPSQPHSFSKDLQSTMAKGLQALYPTGYEITHLKMLPSINQDRTYYLEISPKTSPKIERFIVKIIGRGAYALKRTLERTQMASSLGVSPRIRWASVEKNVLILDFVDGGLSHNLAPEFLEKVAANFKKFHDHYKNLSHYPEVYTISMRAWMRQKELLAHNAPLPFGFENLFTILKEIDEVLMPGDHPLPIHGDATYTNILITKEGVQFIDWGDSVTSDPFDDLGMFANDYALSLEEQEFFLKAYLGHDISRIERARFYFKRLQALLHQSLWYLLMAYQQNKNTPIFSRPFLSWIVNRGHPEEMLMLKREMHSQEIFPVTPADFTYLGLTGIRQFLYETKTADFKKHKAILQKGIS